MNSEFGIRFSFIYSDWSEDKENDKLTNWTHSKCFFRNGNSEFGMPDIISRKNAHAQNKRMLHQNGFKLVVQRLS